MFGSTALKQCDYMAQTSDYYYTGKQCLPPGQDFTSLM